MGKLYLEQRVVIKKHSEWNDLVIGVVIVSLIAALILLAAHLACPPKYTKKQK